jgi:HlyD family secretion protein
MQFPLIGKVRQPTPWIIGLAAAGVLGVGGITYGVIQSQTATPDIAGITVTVNSQDLRVRIPASGTVQPIQSVNISPKAAGIVAELYVEQGDRVNQGQVLARMESREAEAQLLQAQAQVNQARARLAELEAGNRPEEINQAQARVEQARAQLNQSEARLDLAEQRVRRNQSLVDQGAISRDQFDEILNELNTAQANLEQNQAQVREQERSLALLRQGSRAEAIAQAQAQLDEAIGSLRAAQVRVDDTYVRAPFSGIVTQKFANEGAFVTPTTSASEASSATSTAIVAVAQGLEILAEVPEVDIQRLRVGQPVEIRADAYPGETFQGRVRLIAPEAVVRQNVTSFQVRVTITTGQDRLRSGMNTDVIFLGEELQDALVVPTVAIVTQNGQTGVLVPNERNQPEFRPVTIGTDLNNQTQILEGLNPGDRVFTSPPPEWESQQQQAEN